MSLSFVYGLSLFPKTLGLSNCPPSKLLCNFLHLILLFNCFVIQVLFWAWISITFDLRSPSCPKFLSLTKTCTPHFKNYNIWIPQTLFADFSCLPSSYALLLERKNALLGREFRFSESLFFSFTHILLCLLWLVYVCLSYSGSTLHRSSCDIIQLHSNYYVSGFKMLAIVYNNTDDTIKTPTLPMGSLTPKHCWP